MKKQVNGKVVDVDTQLFLCAAEGEALNRKASSLVQNTIESRNDFVRDIVSTYNDILSSLVYPLNMIEEEIKYAVISLVLKERLKDKYGDVQMQVGSFIKIEFEPGRILKLLAGTWAIEATNQTYIPSQIDMLAYSKDIGYKEYTWALQRLLNNEDTQDFYRVFMSNFLRACKGEKFVLDWELQHILEYGYVPEQIEIPENKIIDIDEGVEYFLDIYCTGRKETDDTVMRVQISPNREIQSSLEKRRIKVYNFEVYGKKLTDLKNGNRTEKISGAQSKGFSSLFEVLLLEGINDDLITLLKYRGIVSQNQLLFEVNNEIYLAPFDIYSKPTRLISNVKLYGFESGRVYVSKTVRTRPGIAKESIYSYELGTGKPRICRTRFVPVTD